MYANFDITLVLLAAVCVRALTSSLYFSPCNLLRGTDMYSSWLSLFLP